MDAAALKERTKKAEANRKWREQDKRKRDEEKDRKQGKQASTLKPNSESKAKSVVDEDDDSDDDSHRGKVAKKQKQDLQVAEVKITAYIHIQSSTPRLTSSSKLKGKASAPPVSVKGPCFFQLHQTYDEFRAILAKELPCRLNLLPVDNVSWKYEKPANDPKKPLTSTSGYEALMMSLKEKKTGHVIVVFMPPPKTDDTVSQFYSLALYVNSCIQIDLGYWRRRLRCKTI